MMVAIRELNKQELQAVNGGKWVWRKKATRTADGRCIYKMYKARVDPKTGKWTEPK